LSRIAGAIGTRRRRLATHPLRIDIERRRLLRRGHDLTPRDRELLERVDPNVHASDSMHSGDSEHYLRVGLSAVRCVDAAGVQTPARILDLPCGHGRVLRALAAAFPGAAITAADVDRGGVEFCAKRFGATPLHAPTDPSALELPPGGFDLIWCGSLATHLDAQPTVDLLEALSAALARGGTLLITTHGDFVAQRLAAGEMDYQLDAAAVARVLDGWGASGFGYADYGWSPGYGVSLIAPAWLREHAPLPVAHFAERGWDHHQDVYALTRPA
jgi:SAM-dependent methyltransferase